MPETGRFFSLNTFGVDSGGTIPRGHEYFGCQCVLAGSLMVWTNNTLLQTFTANNTVALVNRTRNNDLLTVAGSLSSRPLCRCWIWLRLAPGRPTNPTK
jgi:hypothetical protein